LSSYEQESEIKACGFSYTERTVFLDRFFLMPEELLHWGGAILHEVYEDEYYYHCKYFYYLLTSAYSVRDVSARMSNYCEKGVRGGKMIDRSKGVNGRERERQSMSGTELIEYLNANIKKIIVYW
jgi:hypothetical protein